MDYKHYVATEEEDKKTAYIQKDIQRREEFFEAKGTSLEDQEKELQEDLKALDARKESGEITAFDYEINSKAINSLLIGVLVKRAEFSQGFKEFLDKAMKGEFEDPCERTDFQDGLALARFHGFKQDINGYYLCDCFDIQDKLEGARTDEERKYWHYFKEGYKYGISTNQPGAGIGAFYKATTAFLEGYKEARIYGVLQGAGNFSDEAKKLLSGAGLEYQCDFFRGYVHGEEETELWQHFAQVEA